jgi:predicted nucleic acid-binding protein
VPIVVADTGPLNYLVLIRDIDVLPQLFKTVLAPQAVFAELGHVEAPARVKAWIDTPPPWLELGRSDEFLGWGIPAAEVV